MAGFLTNDGEALTNRLPDTLKDMLENSELGRSTCVAPRSIGNNFWLRVYAI